ncbi:Hypothetical protein DEACI_0362 [Acididesulfobacillus acetoxydans]|uniref:Uncharacterized protein n=1 Tax=Acididesulfobacillus acetoxydans TaxID=1561005 RepID=A0A8S0Y1N8_9FIRM|nr:Hypothetical protein DEACI_0362 [Acididesulfobacillus acetoxydans]
MLKIYREKDENSSLEKQEFGLEWRISNRERFKGFLRSFL